MQQQVSQRELENFTKRYSLFGDIDKEVETIYTKIKEKNIEIKTPKDLERVDRFFLPTIKKILKMVDNSKQFDTYIKDEMKNTIVINIFVRFCESYSLDPITSIPFFGKEAYKMFTNAQKNMDLRG